VPLTDGVNASACYHGIRFDGLRVAQCASTLNSVVWRLVAGIGAIGIARCFTYGGFKKRPLYDAAQPVSSEITHDEYKKAASKNEPSINHFYTKLLKLKDLMKTNAGKKRAQQRHQVMLDFLHTFQLEIEGKA